MLGPPAGAQHVNPTAELVKEEQLLGELKRISGECSIPDQKACTIEQLAGRDWRHFHEVTLRWIGGIAILGMLAVVALFYLILGSVRIAHGRSGGDGAFFRLRAPRALDGGGGDKNDLGALRKIAPSPDLCEFDV